LGITEPGIIAAEPPKPHRSQLVIMPDIEKRLERSCAWVTAL